MSTATGSSKTKLAGLKLYGALPTMVRQRLVRALKPSYTIGTMTAVTRSDGAVLHVRHSYNTAWAMPGGLVNRREPVDLGAIRETREECGIEIVLVGEAAVTVDPRKQIVRVIYRAELAPGVLDTDAHAASEEIAEIAWLAPGTSDNVSVESLAAFDALIRSEGQRL